MLGVLSVVLLGATVGLVVRGNQHASAKLEPLTRGLSRLHPGHLSEAEAAEVRAEEAEVQRAGAEGEDRVLAQEVANLSSNTGNHGLNFDPVALVGAIGSLLLGSASWVFRKRDASA